MGIAHGSHAVIGVVVLSEGLPCILDIGKCLIEIGCNFLWALPAPMAAAGAPLTIQYDLSTTVPSFQSVWHAPPNGRLTSKHAKRILLVCARAKATTKCCSHDCLSAFRKKEMLKKAARWRMQWHKLSRRQRRQVLLDYLRKKHVHQASMESVASMDDDAGAHGVCGQGRNVYTRERNFSGNPKTYRQHKFLNVQMCSAAWRLLTGVSGNVHCRTNRKRLLGHTCSPAAKISRPSHMAMVRLCRCACTCASVCRSSTTTRTTSTCQSPGNISYLACCRVGMMSEQQGWSHSYPNHPTYGRSVKSSPPPTSEKCGFTELWISDVAPNVVSSIGRLWWPARSTRPSGSSWPLNIDGCNYPKACLLSGSCPSGKYLPQS